MARPSKLTDRQKCEIQRRHVAGETTRALAKAFRVSQATISSVVSGRTEIIKNLANSMAADELKYDSLPVSDQLAVRSLADQLKCISEGLATAANHNANVAARLAQAADMKSLSINESAQETDIKGVAMLVETANRASSIGLNLLNANKEKVKGGPLRLTLEQLVCGSYEED